MGGGEGGGGQYGRGWLVSNLKGDSSQLSSYEDGVKESEESI